MTQFQTGTLNGPETPDKYRFGYLLKSPFAQRQQGFLVESLQILHLVAD
jgi:hypothetical protein